MADSKLFQASWELVKALDKVADKSLPLDISNIVKTHSKAAAAASVAAGWIPGAGGTMAVGAAAASIWSMYVRINKKIDLPFTENIIKSLASGIATNLAAYAVATVIGAGIISFIPGIGSVTAAVIAGTTSYALTIASGFVYIKILTNIFKAKQDPTSFSLDDLKDIANETIKTENIKEVMKEAKKEYKSNK